MVAPSEKIASIITSKDILDEDRALYVYGLHQIGVTILNLATTIVVGLLAHMLWQSLVFLAAYIPLRKYAGGYHAKTEFRCYLLSTALLCTALFAIHSIPTTAVILLSTFAFSSVAIILLAPVDNFNKPLDSTEYVVYRKRSRLVLLVHWAVVAVTPLISQSELAAVIVIADTVLAGMLILGFLRNRFGAPQ